jgi:uncharacterized membrane protein
MQEFLAANSGGIFGFLILVVIAFVIVPLVVNQTELGADAESKKAIYKWRNIIMVVISIFGLMAALRTETVNSVPRTELDRTVVDERAEAAREGRK